jgi:hypothetical protein
MNQLLDSDLKEAFASQASRIPPDAVAHLRGIDYRPRTSRLSPRLTVGTLAGGGAVAGAVISVVLVGGAQPAFAGWSASPTPGSAGQTATADATCQAQLAAAPAAPGSTGGSDWNAVTTDVRGPFTVVVYQDGATDATCFTGPSLTILARSAAGGASMSVAGSESGGGAAHSSSIVVSGNVSGGIEHMTVAHMDSTSAGPYTLVEGQVDPAVTGVTLVRSDGEDVEASTGGDWFVAWWPGSQGVTSAEITTANGVTTEPLNMAPLPPPPNGTACDPSAPATSSTVYCTGGSGGAGTADPSTGVDPEGAAGPSTNVGG